MSGNSVNAPPWEPDDSSLGFDCSHCGRNIPTKMVATYDCSGCPLAVPCVRVVFGAAWPIDDSDDDDAIEVRDPEPVLAGGA
jgi:hypothetical protein